MPELAAHLERVARDLAERVDKLMDAADHLVWATEIEIQGGPRTRSFILQHRAKCRYNVEQTKKALAALTGEQNGVAAALAACAREAKLEEAKWWEHLVTDALPCPADCMYCARMAALERAVGEKASLDPQRGQHDS